MKKCFALPAPAELEFTLTRPHRVCCAALVRLWQILLQKSFWGVERKFLEPLVRFTRGDVRDHIGSPKIDHGPPQRR
jgi:hypothetical protein